MSKLDENSKLDKTHDSAIGDLYNISLLIMSVNMHNLPRKGVTCRSFASFCSVTFHWWTPNPYLVARRILIIKKIARGYLER